MPCPLSSCNFGPSQSQFHVHAIIILPGNFAAFSPFPTMFQKLCYSGMLKLRILLQKVKPSKYYLKFCEGENVELKENAAKMFFSLDGK